MDISNNEKALEARRNEIKALVGYQKIQQNVQSESYISDEFIFNDFYSENWYRKQVPLFPDEFYPILEKFSADNPIGDKLPLLRSQSEIIKR